MTKLGAPRLRSHAVAHWYWIPLTETQLLQSDYDRIRQRAYLETHCRCDVMLWLAFTTDGGAELYIPPSAVAACNGLLKTDRARPCDLPRVSVLRVSGHRRAHPAWLADASDEVTVPTTAGPVPHPTTDERHD